MISLKRFEEITDRELRRIPDRYKRGVAGFFVIPRALRQSGSLTGVYILGHYHTNNRHMGSTVTLYYGSFRRVFRGRSERKIRREISRTLAHELLHHWEHRAGRDELGDEDRRRLNAWKRRLGLPTDQTTGRDLLEALLFLFSLLLILAFMARLIG
ncbi:MAG: metallopeptidase family protein [Candidatus Riflebacteria bacterium]|nr:metallopeptidase family protein [Candidatus Riflebacteria bacterium]